MVVGSYLILLLVIICIKCILMKRCYKLTTGWVVYKQQNCCTIKYTVLNMVKHSRRNSIIKYKMTTANLYTVDKELSFSAQVNKRVSVMYDRIHPEVCIVSPYIGFTIFILKLLCLVSFVVLIISNIIRWL